MNRNHLVVDNVDFDDATASDKNEEEEEDDDDRGGGGNDDGGPRLMEGIGLLTIVDTKSRNTRWHRFNDIFLETRTSSGGSLE